MNNLKRVLTGILTLSVVIVGAVIISSDAEADELAVHYTHLPVSEYWSTESAERKVPVETGYVFGGWYLDSNGDDALTEAELGETKDLTTLDEQSYAKFVPAYVLSVKTQLQKTVSEANGVNCEDSYLRLISSVDSNNYEEVGFTIHYNKKTTEALTQTYSLTQLYKYTELKSEESEGETPSSMFGAASQYFSILRIDDIANTNFEKVIYVRPWWVTPDGTMVYGMSRYVRVMDGYANNRYISVPVNLMVDGAVEDKVGIGQVSMVYPEGFSYVETDASICQGISYAEFQMNCNTDERKITFLAKSCVPTDAEFDHNFVDIGAGEHLFGCVWFTVDDTATSGMKDFTFPTVSFCDWHEKLNENVKLGTYTYALEKNDEEITE